MEASNGRLRDECLNAHRFRQGQTLTKPRSRIGAETITIAVLTQRLAGRRRSNMLPPRMRRRPNQRRKSTLSLDEKPGDSHAEGFNS